VNLAANFHLDEFDCHDGTAVPGSVLPAVMRLAADVLQPIRDVWTGPLLIVSGYRTPAWNLRVGGVQRSTHLTGEGCDIRPVHLADVPRLHDLILAMHGRKEIPALGGLGEYPRWVHVDTRKHPSGRLRRWHGRAIGSEPG
jgi:uncharacterized protein YcbK (DUF882 family)